MKSPGTVAGSDGASTTVNVDRGQRDISDHETCDSPRGSMVGWITIGDDTLMRFDVAGE